MNQRNVLVLLVCIIIINITPACAVNVSGVTNELEDLSKSNDVNNIEKWHNGTDTEKKAILRKFLQWGLAGNSEIFDLFWNMYSS